MFRRDEGGEKSQAVKDAEARITAEEEAMTAEEREARYQRLARKLEARSLFAWRGKL